MKEISIKSIPNKFIWLIIALITLFAGFLLYPSTQTITYSNNFPSKIKETYVAVLPFKNNTADPKLDVIGEMAADWIRSGLHETGTGKIISVAEARKMVNPVSGSKVSQNSREVQAPYLIEGNYYKVKDEFIFSSNIKDLKTGEIVFTFPMNEKKSPDPMISIELLKQRILGYWVTKDLPGYERRPPVYQAYKAYLDAGKLWYIDAKQVEILMRKAIELDSNFHYAAFGYAHNLINQGKYEQADSIINSYQKKKTLLSPMEAEFLNGLRSRITRNFKQNWQHWHSPYILSYWGKVMSINNG